MIIKTSRGGAVKNALVVHIGFGFRSGAGSTNVKVSGSIPGSPGLHVDMLPSAYAGVFVIDIHSVQNKVLCECGMETGLKSVIQVLVHY